MERVDGLLRLAHLLVAAPDVAQVDGVQRLRVELRERLERLVVAPGGERLARLHLELVDLLVGAVAPPEPAPLDSIAHKVMPGEPAPSSIRPT